MTMVAGFSGGAQVVERASSPALMPALASPWVRGGRGADAQAITALIDSWADQGLTIRRCVEDVRTNIETFVVAEAEGRIVACAAMEPIGAMLGEIRSVSVAGDARGGGVGRRVVLAAVERAAGQGLSRVVLLTKTPAFFSACGFQEVAAGELPAHYVGVHLPARGRTVEGRCGMMRVLRG